MCNCIKKLKEQIIEEYTIDDVKPLIDQSDIGLNSIVIAYKPWSNKALKHPIRHSYKSFEFKYCPFCRKKL